MQVENFTTDIRTLDVAADMSTRDATIVAVELSIRAHHGLTEFFYGTGTAKRDPSDKPNREVGTKLALARALHSLAHKLEKQANGLVKHADDIKEMKRKLAQNSAEVVE